MKKYYLAETDEEIFEGDVISVEFEKEFKGGRKIRRTEEFEVTEDSVPYLLDMGVLEEGEDEEDEELIDFDEEDFALFKEAVAQDIEELNEKISSLEKEIEELKSKQDKPKKEAKK